MRWLTEKQSFPADDLPAELLVVRSDRKTVAIHVSHDQIEVRAPRFIRQRDIARFVEANRAWIVRKHEEKSRKHAERLTLEHGSTIFYKGRSLRLELVEQKTADVIATDAQLSIVGPGATDGRAGAILQQWLMTQARAWLVPRSHALADYLGVGDRLRDVVLRKTRSKWGHCTAQGRIQYNWLIMLAPDGVIDYMISHEVCHLLHMNHSPAFWQAVASVCPDYSLYEGWLKQHEHRLWF